LAICQFVTFIMPLGVLLVMKMNGMLLLKATVFETFFLCYNILRVCAVHLIILCIIIYYELAMARLA